MRIKYGFFEILFITTIGVSCNSTPTRNTDIHFFDKVQLNSTEKFIDSICDITWKLVPIKFKGWPNPTKGKSYYDERPVKDSAGNLLMYFVYNISSDTSEVINRYYFHKNQLIQVQNVIFRHKSFGHSVYYFRDNKMFCFNTIELPFIAEDSLLNLARLYLLKKDTTKKPTH